MTRPGSEHNFASMLKPFHDRAALAEERLKKLEAALESNEGSGKNARGKILNSLIELKKKLEEARVEQLAEREKAAKELEVSNLQKEKLKYQILHLKKSLEEADRKLLELTGDQS